MHIKAFWQIFFLQNPIYTIYNCNAQKYFLITIFTDLPSLTANQLKTKINNISQRKLGTLRFENVLCCMYRYQIYESISKVSLKALDPTTLYFKRN